MPIFIQIASIIIFGYSLWTYTGFNYLQSTAVVLGVITGLTFTGGIVSVMSKQISFYWNYNDHYRAFHTIVHLIKKGLLFLVLMNVVLFSISLVTGIFPIEMILISAIYSFLIGFVLLLIAPLHVVKKQWFITIAVFLASSLALCLIFYTSLPVYYTHWIGMLFLIGMVISYWIYYYKKKKITIDIRLKDEIKNSFLVYHNHIYFIYGSLFFVFVFMDRLIAWSAPREDRLTFLLFFEKDYEIGMDLAMLPYFLLIGVLEYSIISFTTYLDKAQLITPLNGVTIHNTNFIKKYWKNIGVLFIIGCLSSLTLLFMIKSKYGYQFQFKEHLSALNIEIAIIGSIGYFFLSWAVLNVLYFFTMGQPLKPLKTIIIACICNFTIGLLLSRYIAYHYSVIGFLVGSIVFTILTTIELIKFFKKTDYYYYATF